jgi:hypothetical protein
MQKHLLHILAMLFLLHCLLLILAVAAQAQEWMLRLSEVPQLSQAVLKTPQLLCGTPMQCTFTTASASSHTPTATAAATTTAAQQQQSSDTDGWEDWEVQVDEVQHDTSPALVTVQCETLVGKLACLLLQNRAHELQELREAKTVNVAAVVSAVQSRLKYATLHLLRLLSIPVTEH